MCQCHTRAWSSLAVGAVLVSSQAVLMAVLTVQLRLWLAPGSPFTFEDRLSLYAEALTYF